MVDSRRVRILKPGEPGGGPVVYAMSRDQRVDDNWALSFAQGLAIERKLPLVVACPMAADYPRAPRRQIDFMMSGLREVETRLAELGIPFFAAVASADSRLLLLTTTLRAAALVTDFNPLKESRQWKARLAKKINVPFFEVDAHNIIPCWEISDKQEYAAYTIRPKIRRQLDEFLSPMPTPQVHPFPADMSQIPEGWSRLEVLSRGNAAEAARPFFEPGAAAAQRQLGHFLSSKLEAYSDQRNDPTIAGQSDLSPYLHFGQLSAQRAALEAQRHDAHIASHESFLEELIVRRELSDNFCYYNSDYDRFDGFPDWARKTLDEHRTDPRAYVYDRGTLEAADTHDELWNAAQTEMMVTGKMHGYLRMYWAKKLLQWAVSPEEAMADAIYLNNRYELDGHDPNGYAGIAWSIGGVHDRAWPEREIFGKIRYMSYDGCRRKFSVDNYVTRITAVKTGAGS